MTRQDMMIATLHEIENGEGNGVVHWYCSPAHREDERANYGDVEPIDLAPEDVPDDTRCETCGMELDAYPMKAARREIEAGN